MKRTRTAMLQLAIALGAILSTTAIAKVRVGPAPVRFETVDVLIDPSGHALATWQIEITARGASVVGIEGGEHPAFAEPPYYDPVAIQREHVILAALSTATADELPARTTRVATIHLAVEAGEPDITAELVVAATVDGTAIPAKILIGAPES